MNQENIIHNEEGKQSVENNRNTPDDSMWTVTTLTVSDPTNRTSSSAQPRPRQHEWSRGEEMGLVGVPRQSPGEQGQ